MNGKLIDELPASLKNWVQTRLRGGHYADEEAYIRDLIKRDQEASQKLDALLEELKAGEMALGSGLCHDLRSAEEISNFIDDVWEQRAIEDAAPR